MSENWQNVYYCNHPSPSGRHIIFYIFCFNIPINNILKLAKIHAFLLVITNILEYNYWLCSTDKAVTTITRTNLFGRCVFKILAAYIRWNLKVFRSLDSKFKEYPEMLTPALLLIHHLRLQPHLMSRTVMPTCQLLPNEMRLYTVLLYFCRQLYMFRMIPSSITTSTPKM